MSKPSEPWLQAPCEENQWKWRVYGLGMVWDHAQQWQALWKLHYMQMASGTDTGDNGPRRDPGVSQ